MTTNSNPVIKNDDDDKVMWMHDLRTYTGDDIISEEELIDILHEEKKEDLEDLQETSQQ